jgi:hypothetical protein
MVDYKVIISRYNEDIEWVKTFEDYVVFNKGSSVGLSEDILNHSYYLPNVGKDCDVILRYITTHYYNLPNKISFCQGYYEDHYDLSMSGFKDQLLSLVDGYSILDYRHNKYCSEHANHPTFNIEHWPDKLDNYINILYKKVDDNNRSIENLEKKIEAKKNQTAPAIAGTDQNSQQEWIKNQQQRKSILEKENNSINTNRIIIK